MVLTNPEFVVTPETVPKDKKGWPIMPTAFVKVTREHLLLPGRYATFKGTVKSFEVQKEGILVWIQEDRSGFLRPARPDSIEVKRRTSKRRKQYV